MKKTFVLLVCLVALCASIQMWRRANGVGAGTGAEAIADAGAGAGAETGVGSAEVEDSNVGAAAAGVADLADLPDESSSRSLAVGDAALVSDWVATRAAAPASAVSAEKFLGYKRLFADAPVISSVTEAGTEAGQEVDTRIVETSLKQGYVKVRETYETRDGNRVLVNAQAMVANQLMLQRPSGVSEDSFFGALRSAGARELKDVGGAVIATFDSRPQDPHALDDYLARVREVLGADTLVEFNYVRRLI